MVLSQKKNCNRCKMASQDENGNFVCGLKYKRNTKTGEPMEACLKPQTADEVSKAKTMVFGDTSLTFYFLDTENLGKDWFSVVALQHPQAKYYAFYTNNSPNVPMNELNDVVRFCNNGSLELIKCENGTLNALDFQLVLMAGQFLELHPDDKICIVSKDTGYDVLAKWPNSKKRIKRLTAKALFDADIREKLDKKRKEQAEALKALEQAAAKKSQEKADEKKPEEPHDPFDDLDEIDDFYDGVWLPKPEPDASKPVVKEPEKEPEQDDLLGPLPIPGSESPKPETLDLLLEDDPFSDPAQEDSFLSPDLGKPVEPEKPKKLVIHDSSDGDGFYVEPMREVLPPVITEKQPVDPTDPDVLKAMTEEPKDVMMEPDILELIQMDLSCNPPRIHRLIKWLRANGLTGAQTMRLSDAILGVMPLKSSQRMSRLFGKAKGIFKGDDLNKYARIKDDIKKFVR